MDIERIFIRTNIKDNIKDNIYETSSEYISSDEKNKDKKFIKNKQPVITNNNVQLNKHIIIY